LVQKALNPPLELKTALTKRWICQDENTVVFVKMLNFPRKEIVLDAVRENTVRLTATKGRESIPIVAGPDLSEFPRGKKELHEFNGFRWNWLKASFLQAGSVRGAPHPCFHEALEHDDRPLAMFDLRSRDKRASSRSLRGP